MLNTAASCSTTRPRPAAGPSLRLGANATGNYQIRGGRHWSRNLSAAPSSGSTRPAESTGGPRCVGAACAVRRGCGIGDSRRAPCQVVEPCRLCVPAVRADEFDLHAAGRRRQRRHARRNDDASCGSCEGVRNGAVGTRARHAARARPAGESRPPGRDPRCRGRSVPARDRATDAPHAVRSRVITADRLSGTHTMRSAYCTSRSWNARRGAIPC